eukprot:scaffold106273_cov47-Attheya_sp.AAC.1
MLYSMEQFIYVIDVTTSYAYVAVLMEVCRLMNNKYEDECNGVIFILEQVGHDDKQNVELKENGL